MGNEWMEALTFEQNISIFINIDRLEEEQRWPTKRFT